MTKKRGLGRGLSALLENVETDITTGTNRESTSRVLGSVALLPISHIEANPFQPRSEFDKESLIELSKSISEYGIIQPVTVRKMGFDKFQLISGERRFRASQISGLTEIPAYIRVANDQTMLEMALVENIQRRDLDAIEIAISYQRLIEECRLTQEGLSEKVGKKRTTISNYLRLLKLPAIIQSGLRNGLISMGHARAMVNVESEKKQIALFNRINEEGLSVRQIEELSRNTKENPQPKDKDTVPLSFLHQKLKSDLIDFFGTKVDLRRNGSGKGKIEINFSTEQELQRIVDRLEL